MHARVRQVEQNAEGEYYITRDKFISIHFAENQKQWEQGVIRLQIGYEQAEVSIDALMSGIFTAYEPTLLRQAVGFFEQVKLRMFSFFLSHFKK